MEPYGLGSVARTVRTITSMLWRGRNEAAGRSPWSTHRQSRWWDWVDGLCEPLESTNGQPEARPVELDARSTTSVPNSHLG